MGIQTSLWRRHGLPGRILGAIVEFLRLEPPDAVDAAKDILVEPALHGAGFTIALVASSALDVAVLDGQQWKISADRGSEGAALTSCGLAQATKRINYRLRMGVHLTPNKAW